MHWQGGDKVEQLDDLEGMFFSQGLFVDMVCLLICLYEGVFVDMSLCTAHGSEAQVAAQVAAVESWGIGKRVVEGWCAGECVQGVECVEGVERCL